MKRIVINVFYSHFKEMYFEFSVRIEVIAICVYKYLRFLASLTIATSPSMTSREFGIIWLAGNTKPSCPVREKNTRIDIEKQFHDLTKRIKLTFIPKFESVCEWNILCVVNPVNTAA